MIRQVKLRHDMLPAASVSSLPDAAEKVSALIVSWGRMYHFRLTMGMSHAARIAEDHLECRRTDGRDAGFMAV